MGFGRYLKDRFIDLILGLAAGISIILLMAIFNVSSLLIVLVAAVYIIFLVPAFLMDYFRKHSFYQLLIKNRNNLDKKNLLAEIVPEPGFYEGQILHETVYEMGKSMTEQISQAEQSVSDFKDYVEMWVHEAKLPVAALLLKTYNDQNNENRQIRKQLLKLDAFTEQILYFTRAEVAEKDFLIKESSLSKIFGTAAARMREELQENGFEIKIAGLDKTVLTDAKWMEFVLIQLISNSIKYQAENREHILEINADNEENRTLLHIRDNGIGIPSGDLDRVFEKSFTGENGRAREKSTGMGLYIVKNLCSKLGHGISVDSAQGEYTQFTIEFPSNNYYRP